MKHPTLIQTILAACALVGASAVFAADDSNGTAMATPVKNASHMTITPQSKYFNVNGGDVVDFTLADGSHFAWKFDGNNNYVNLIDIAPQGAQVPAQLRVYVDVKDDSGSDDSGDSSGSESSGSESSGSSEI